MHLAFFGKNAENRLPNVSDDCILVSDVPKRLKKKKKDEKQIQNPEYTSQTHSSFLYLAFSGTFTSYCKPVSCF